MLTDSERIACSYMQSLLEMFCANDEAPAPMTTCDTTGAGALGREAASGEAVPAARRH